MTRLWVRHAPVVAAPGHLWGRTDVEADVRDPPALDLPRHVPWLVSPLRRAMATAEALWPGGVFVPEPALMEQDFGVWEGRLHGDLPDIWADPARWRPEGGESFEDVVARIATLSPGLPGACVLICHAGPIRAAIALARGLPPAEALALPVPHWSVSAPP